MVPGEGGICVPIGMVTKAIGGFFDVHAEGVTRRCRARGVFKKRGVTIMVGDRVEFSPIGTEGIVEKVLPRRTQLIRPPIANVDQALMVFSLVTPDLNVHLLDRILTAAAVAGIDCQIVLTKSDLVTPEQIEEVRRVYESAGYRVLVTASTFDQGVDAVRDALKGKLSVFAGPSGAGKSTLANAILPALGLKMGEISDKAGLGRHTTRHVELFSVAPDTWVADAPGFSQLEVSVSSQELRRYLPEFLAVADACPYRGCLHIDEQECAVKDAVSSGRINRGRYESYRMMYDEIRTREENMY